MLPFLGGQAGRTARPVSALSPNDTLSTLTARLEDSGHPQRQLDHGQQDERPARQGRMGVRTSVCKPGDRVTDEDDRREKKRP